MTPAQKKAVTKAFGPAAVEFLNGLAEAIAALHARQEDIEKQLLTLHQANVAQAVALEKLRNTTPSLDAWTALEGAYKDTATRDDIAAAVETLRMRLKLEDLQRHGELLRLLDGKQDKRRPFMEWLFGPKVRA